MSIRTSYSRWTAKDTKTNAIATATKAAPGPGLRHYLCGFIISASQAPAATQQAEVRQDSTEIMPIELPAAVFAPVTFNLVHPIAFPENAAVNLVVPALGASVICSVVIFGYTDY